MNEPDERGKAVTIKRGKEKVSSGHEPIDDLLKFAIDVIHHCGEKALSFYGRGQKDVKFDEGLVTEAELQLREFFQDRLFARFRGSVVDHVHDGVVHARPHVEGLKSGTLDADGQLDGAGHVGNVGEVAALAAVAQDGDGPVLLNRPLEGLKRQIWALAGSPD